MQAQHLGPSVHQQAPQMLQFLWALLSARKWLNGYFQIDEFRGISLKDYASSFTLLEIVFHLNKQPGLLEDQHLTALGALQFQLQALLLLQFQHGL